VKIEKIGVIDNSTDGAAVYVLFQIEDSEKELHEPSEWKELVRDFMVSRYWNNGSGIGTQFCTDVRVQLIEFTDDRFIGAAYMQYDI
jgi:hypothetical protein